VNLLFVCLGNICRSPLAESLFKFNLEKKGKLAFFKIDSCGTSNWHQGEKADHRTLKNAKENGVYITHLAKQITQNDVNQFDYLFVMDNENYKNVLQMFPESEKKLFLLTHFSKIKHNQIIPDPYFGTENDFQDVLNLLNIVTNELADFLIEKHCN